MAKKFDDFGQGDEFFPLEDSSIMSSPSDVPSGKGKVKGILGKTKSYFKNVAKTARGVAFKITEDQMPNVAEFGRAMQNIGAQAKSSFDESRSKAASKISEMKGGASGKLSAQVGDAFKGLKDDIVKGIKTGDFTGKGDDFSGMFGDDDDSWDDMDFGEMGMDGDEGPSMATASVAAAAASKSTKSAVKPLVAAQMASSRHMGRSITSAVVASATASTKAQLKMSKMTLAMQQAQFQQHMDSQQAIYGALKNIGDFMANNSSKDISAAMEYRAKSIAMQEDSLSLLKDLKQTMAVGLSVSAALSLPKDMTESERSKILKSGFDSDEYFKMVASKAKNALSNTMLGQAAGMGSMMGDMGGAMGKSPVQMAMDMAMGAIPGMFLSRKTKGKMSRVNDIFESMGGALIGKMNSMARFSDNPLVRGIASVMGADDMMGKRSDRGLKDPAGRAVFDNRVHRTIVEVIPGFLAKILAATNGQEEIYYDMKSGGYRTSSSAVKEAKRKIDKAFESNAMFNEVHNHMTDAGLTGAKNVGLDPSTVKRDFDKIKRNIVESRNPFEPDRAREPGAYRDFLLRGLSGGDRSLDYYIQAFGKLRKGDQLAFSTGLSKTFTNLDKTFSEMNEDGAPAAVTQYKDRYQDSLNSTALATLHLDRNLGDMKGQARINAIQKKLEMDERNLVRNTGQVGVSGLDDSFNPTDGVGGGGGATSAQVLNQIHDLLSDGIIVFPTAFDNGKGKVPKHLMERWKDRGVASQIRSEQKKREAEKEKVLSGDILKRTVDLQRQQKVQNLGMGQVSAIDMLRGNMAGIQNNNILNSGADSATSWIEKGAHWALHGKTANAGEGSEIQDSLMRESVMEMEHLMRSAKDVGFLKKVAEDTKDSTSPLGKALHKSITWLAGKRATVAKKFESMGKRAAADPTVQEYTKKFNEVKENLAKGFEEAKKSGKSFVDQNVKPHIKKHKGAFTAAKQGIMGAARKGGNKVTELLHGKTFAAIHDDEIRNRNHGELIPFRDDSNDGVDASFIPDYARHAAGFDLSAYSTKSTGGGSGIVTVRLADISGRALDKLNGRGRNSAQSSNTALALSNAQMPSTGGSSRSTNSSSVLLLEGPKTPAQKETIKIDFEEMQRALKTRTDQFNAMIAKVQDPEQRKIIADQFRTSTQSVIDSVSSRIPPSMKSEYGKLRGLVTKHYKNLSDKIMANKDVKALTSIGAHVQAGNMGAAEEEAKQFRLTKKTEISAALGRMKDDFDAQYEIIKDPEQRKLLLQTQMANVEAMLPPKLVKSSKEAMSMFKKFTKGIIDTAVKHGTDVKVKLGTAFASGGGGGNSIIESSALPAGDGITKVHVEGFSGSALENLLESLKSLTLQQAGVTEAESKKKGLFSNLFKKKEGKTGIMGHLGSGVGHLAFGGAQLAGGALRLGGGMIGGAFQGLFGAASGFGKGLMGAREKHKYKMGLGTLVKQVKDKQKTYPDALAMVTDYLKNGKCTGEEAAKFLDEMASIEGIKYMALTAVMSGWLKDGLLSKETHRFLIQNYGKTSTFTGGLGIKLQGNVIPPKKKGGGGGIGKLLSGAGKFLGTGINGILGTVGTALGGAGVKILNNLKDSLLKPHVAKMHGKDKKFYGKDFKHVLNDVLNGKVSAQKTLSQMMSMTANKQLTLDELIVFSQELLNHSSIKDDEMCAILDGWASQGDITKETAKKFKVNLKKHGSLLHGMKDPPAIFDSKRKTLISRMLKTGGHLVTAGLNGASAALTGISSGFAWLKNKFSGHGKDAELAREGSAAQIMAKMKGDPKQAILMMAQDVRAMRQMMAKQHGFPMTKKELEKALKGKKGGGNSSSLFGGMADIGLGAAGILGGGAALGYMGVQGAKAIGSKFDTISHMDAGEATKAAFGVGSSGNYDAQGNRIEGWDAQSANQFSLAKGLQGARGVGMAVGGIKGGVHGIKTGGTKIINFSRSMMGKKQLALPKKKVEPGLVEKIGKFLTDMFSKKPFSDFLKKNVVGKFVSKIVSSIAKSALGRLASGIVGALVKAATPIGWALVAADFVSGMAQANRYFAMGKGGEPNLPMRIVSGILNVVSGLLFGLVPVNIVAPFLYDMIASEETKGYLDGSKKFVSERARLLGVDAARLAEYESMTWDEKMFGGDEKARTILGFKTVKEFKDWETNKYTPSMNLYNQLKGKYGDRVESEPSTPEDKHSQELFRDEYLVQARKLSSSFKTESAGSSTATAGYSTASRGGAEAAAAGATAAAIPKGMPGEGPSISDASKDKAGGEAVPYDKILSGTASVSAAAVADATRESNSQKDAGGAVAASTSNGSLASSPIVTDAKNQNSVIIEQLSIMKAAYKEQTRHNEEVENFLKSFAVAFAKFAFTGEGNDMDPQDADKKPKSVWEQLMGGIGSPFMTGNKPGGNAPAEAPSRGANPAAYDAHSQKVQAEFGQSNRRQDVALQAITGTPAMKNADPRLSISKGS